MPLEYTTNQLFDFYNNNPEVKIYMDSHFSGDKPNPDYLPTLNRLYKKHLENSAPGHNPTPSAEHLPKRNTNYRKYAILGLAGLMASYLIL